MLTAVAPITIKGAPGLGHHLWPCWHSRAFLFECPALPLGPCCRWGLCLGLWPCCSWGLCWCTLPILLQGPMQTICVEVGWLCWVNTTPHWPWDRNDPNVPSTGDLWSLIEYKSWPWILESWPHPSSQSWLCPLTVFYLSSSCIFNDKVRFFSNFLYSTNNEAASHYSFSLHFPNEHDLWEFSCART